VSEMDDNATEKQVHTEAAASNDADMRKIDDIANKMASRGHRREHSVESATNIGGVSGESGGIFTK
jgi:hypothetical protein